MNLRSALFLPLLAILAACHAQGDSAAHGAGQAARQDQRAEDFNGTTAAHPVMVAVRKLQTARFRTEFVMTMTGLNNMTARGRTEYEGCCRLHHVGEDGSERIMLPGAIWTRDAGGAWQESAPDDPPDADPAMRSGDALSTARNVRDEGMTTFNGQAARAWSMDTDFAIAGGVHIVHHEKFYLNDAGLLIGREVEDSPAQAHMRVVETITYDDSIRVRAPH